MKRNEGQRHPCAWRIEEEDADVEAAASKAATIEVIQHSLAVAFSRCN
jgi:hypothetical protein